MEQTVWLYQSFEVGLFTVGFYDPKGKWHPESDHMTRDDAAKRVNYLNGGRGEDEPVYYNPQAEQDIPW